MFDWRILGFPWQYYNSYSLGCILAGRFLAVGSEEPEKSVIHAGMRIKHIGARHYPLRLIYVVFNAVISCFFT